MGKPSLKVDQGLVRKLSTYFLRRPGNLFARVYNDTGRNYPTAAWTAVTFSHERWDTGQNADYASGFWAIATPTRLTAVVSGNYLITGHISFAYALGDMRGIGIRHTRGVAVVYIARHTQLPNTTDPTATAMSIATSYWLREGDYVELMVYQNSGGDLSLQSVGNYTPELTISRIP